MKRDEIIAVLAHQLSTKIDVDVGLKNQGRTLYRRCATIADGFIEEQEKDNGTNKHRSRPR